MTGTPPTTVPALDHTYTTLAEIESIFSQVAVALRTSDPQSTQTSTVLIEDIIDEATEEVDQYAIFAYFSDDLENSRWVRRRASYMGAYFVSIRRGNPGQYKARYSKTVDELQKIQAGTLSIPHIPRRGTISLPRLTNVVVDHTSLYTHGNKIREAPLRPWDSF